MAKKSKKADVDSKVSEKPADADAVVEADAATELVLTKGVGVDLWSDADSTFVPALQDGMPLEERKEAVRKSMQATVAIDDKLNLVSGELLYEVTKNGYWKDWKFTADDGEVRKFASFEEYCEAELNMKRRKAFYLIAIYDKFVVELGLERDVLRRLEWSKAKEMTSIINSDNCEELMDKMGSMSVRQVKAYVAEAKGGGTALTDESSSTEGGADTSEPEVAVKMGFKLFPEQLENVKGALEAAKSMGAGDNANNQLDLICSEFLASSMGAGLEGAMMTLDACVKNLERTFSVKLELSEVDEERYKDLSEVPTPDAEEKISTDDTAPVEAPAK